MSALGWLWLLLALFLLLFYCNLFCLRGEMEPVRNPDTYFRRTLLFLAFSHSALLGQILLLYNLGGKINVLIEYTEIGQTLLSLIFEVGGQVT